MGSTEIANLSSREIANNPDWFIRFLRCGCLGGVRCLHSAGLQCDSFQLLSAEAFALNVEYRGIVKDPVQGTQQGVIFVEVGSPMRRMFVAGKYIIEVTFLVVSPVNQIKEQPGILLVELTVANSLINVSVTLSIFSIVFSLFSIAAPLSILNYFKQQQSAKYCFI